MPRKSAAYTAMGPLLPGQPRLKPQPGLSEREREIFGEVIAHLAAEGLAVGYALRVRIGAM
jgi:hypothetical protein